MTPVDLNGDGVVDEDDVNLMVDIVNGKIPLMNCPGAKKTTVTLCINMSDPAKLIRIYGYNAWGSYVETFIGADVYNCSFASRDYVQRIINQDPYSTTIYRMDGANKEHFNPPMEGRVIYRTIERMLGKPVYTVVMPGNYTTIDGYQTIRTSGLFTVDGEDWLQLWMIKE